MTKNSLLISTLLSFSLLLSACGKSDSSSTGSEVLESLPVQSPGAELPDVTVEDPVNPEMPESPDAGAVIMTPKVLLFNGMGISYSDWKSVEQIVKSMGLTYALVNSAQLNAMTLTQLSRYKLMIVPGGNSHTIVNNLTKTTKIKVRQAVRDRGISYLGFCAGAFAAIGTDFYSNTTSYYGFAVALGDFLPHWYPNGNTSLVAAMTPVRFADGRTRYLTWWDGPSTSEWTGGVIARYNDGKPAISQKKSGAGFVIVSGPHPEAPASWQWDTGTDPDGLDHDIAKSLIQSALNKTLLPAF